MRNILLRPRCLVTLNHVKALLGTLLCAISALNAVESVNLPCTSCSVNLNSSGWAVNRTKRTGYALIYFYFYMTAASLRIYRRFKWILCGNRLFEEVTQHSSFKSHQTHDFTSFNQRSVHEIHGSILTTSGPTSE